MLKIAHRINTIAQLNSTPPEYGVELDLRSYGKDLIIHHDAFSEGELFEDYLKYYKHKLMVINTKAEGLEESILALLQKYNINNYFFLDLSLPFLIKYMNKGEKNIAVRFSEYEPIEFVLKFKNKVNWVWLDCFTELPLTNDVHESLKEHFKICLVSPELQNHKLDMIENFKKRFENMEIDAVCTKRPELW